MSECLFETYRSDLLSHLESDRFRNNQKEEVDVKIPKFCDTASKEAEILAILRDPGNLQRPGKTGAVASEIVSFENKDTTSENQRDILEEAGVDREHIRIVPWNFYAAFDSYNNAKDKAQDRKFWAERLRELITRLENVKVIVVCGNDAWDGLRYYRPHNDRIIQFIPAPHPSRQGLAPEGNRKRLISAWCSAKALISKDYNLYFGSGELQLM